MTDIDTLMRIFCEAGAAAVSRYVEVSGLDPWTMPEFFMPAFILDHIGNSVTATLESGFHDMIERNKSVRMVQGSSETPHDERLLKLAQELNGRRVDMVLFESQEQGKPKDQQSFFALVEFKRGWIDADRQPGKISDRDKLLMLLEHIDTCPWGIACGCAPESHRNWQRSESDKTADRWFEVVVKLPDTYSVPYYFCARAFKRGSDKGRIDELVRVLPQSSP